MLVVANHPAAAAASLSLIDPWCILQQQHWSFKTKRPFRRSCKKEAYLRPSKRSILFEVIKTKIRQIDPFLNFGEIKTLQFQSSSSSFSFSPSTSSSWLLWIMLKKSPPPPCISWPAEMAKSSSSQLSFLPRGPKLYFFIRN